MFPPAAEVWDPRGPYLVPLALLLVTRVATWLMLPQASEDAYITFRYARSLASGSGLVYNPGERVMGFSSPLWTIWNALGYWVCRDPVTWSRATGTLADVATLLVMGGLLRRHASRAASWIFTFFFAVWPYFSAVAVSGMENSLLLSLIALSAALSEKRSPAAGPVLAALALTRPEGLASAALLSLGAPGRERLVGAALATLGLGALWSYYGTVVPQSIIAKSHIYGTPGPWAGRHWWEWLSPFVFGRWPRLGDTSQLIVLCLLTGPAFVLGLASLWRARTSALARAAAALLGVWFGYALLGVAYFWWYLVVPLAGVIATASVGLPRMVQGRALYVAGILFVVSMWTIVPQLYLGRAAEEAASFGQVADFLGRSARPGDKVMLEPIGLIGYSAPLRVVDEVGLVSPRVARRRLEGPGWYADVAARERPDWLVLRAGVLRTGVAFAGAGAPFRSLAERDSLVARYERVAQGDERSGDAALLVLKRIR